MTLTLTSEDKAKAIALFVQGDVHCLCDDPWVVLRGWGEMEGSFESLSHITKPQTSPSSFQESWVASHRDYREGKLPPPPPFTGRTSRTSRVLLNSGLSPWLWAQARAEF